MFVELELDLHQGVERQVGKSTSEKRIFRREKYVWKGPQTEAIFPRGGAYPVPAGFTGGKTRHVFPKFQVHRCRPIYAQFRGDRVLLIAIWTTPRLVG
jgi:hypothetical protein